MIMMAKNSIFVVMDVEEFSSKNPENTKTTSR